MESEASGEQALCLGGCPNLHAVCTDIRCKGQQLICVWSNCKCQASHKHHRVLSIKEVYEQRNNFYSGILSAVDTVLQLPKSYLEGDEELIFTYQQIELKDLRKFSLRTRKVTFKNCQCNYWKRFLCSVAKLCDITHLELLNCKMRNGTLGGLRDMKKLTWLVIDRNQFTKKAARRLVSLQTLSHLSINNNPLSEIQDLEDLLGRMPNIQSIDITMPSLTSFSSALLNLLDRRPPLYVYCPQLTEFRLVKSSTTSHQLLSSGNLTRLFKYLPSLEELSIKFFKSVPIEILSVLSKTRCSSLQFDRCGLQATEIAINASNECRISSLRLSNMLEMKLEADTFELLVSSMPRLTNLYILNVRVSAALMEKVALLRLTILKAVDCEVSTQSFVHVFRRMVQLRNVTIGVCDGNSEVARSMARSMATHLHLLEQLVLGKSYSYPPPLWRSVNSPATYLLELRALPKRARIRFCISYNKWALTKRVQPVFLSLTN